MNEWMDEWMNNNWGFAKWRWGRSTLLHGGSPREAHQFEVRKTKVTSYAPFWSNHMTRFCLISPCSLLNLSLNCLFRRKGYPPKKKKKKHPLAYTASLFWGDTLWGGLFYKMGQSPLTLFLLSAWSRTRKWRKREGGGENGQMVRTTLEGARSTRGKTNAGGWLANSPPPQVHPRNDTAHPRNATMHPR